MRDRRFEPRFPAAATVELSWPDGPARGTIIDLSRSGARIELDRAIPVNTAVRLIVDGLEAAAHVRSCVKKSSLFTLGVEFDPEFQGILKRKR